MPRTRCPPAVPYHSPIRNSKRRKPPMVESEIPANDRTDSAPPTALGQGESSTAPNHWPAPRSLYVHVPFCRHRCGYCNFTLIAGRDERIEDYLRALRVELETVPLAAPLDTLFFGGGTPTHLPLRQLERLWTAVLERVALQSDAEVCFEANPSDLLDDEKLKLLSSLGVNRVSLGVQSLQPRKLRLLERDHDAATVTQVVERARGLFRSLSIDLIFATPEETLSDWLADLSQALALPIDHLSTYSLTIEKGTRFWNRWRAGFLQRAEEDLEAMLYEATIDQVVSRGWEHYEVSNFARPEHRSRHNEVYWTDRGYYAVGPGAARFVDGVRSVNHRSTFTWLRRLAEGTSPVEEQETIDAEQRARDRFVFGLRRLEGIDLREFQRVTGIEASQLAPRAWDRCLEQGWLEITDSSRLRLTRAGLLISDSLWGDFLQTWSEQA